MPTTLDINAVILSAKLGRCRRDAQVDTCAVFAAALYDVLRAQGVRCRMFTAVKSGGSGWAHAVVKAGSRYVDSMGEFSVGIWRARAKIHPTVSVELAYQADSRTDCYESDFDELHAFYVKMLNKAVCAQVVATVA